MKQIKEFTLEWRPSRGGAPGFWVARAPNTIISVKNPTLNGVVAEFKAAAESMDYDVPEGPEKPRDDA